MSTNGSHIREIFCKAVELTSPEERSAYLDQVCGMDSDRRRRVEALLYAHERPERLLDKAAIDCESLDELVAYLGMPPIAEQVGSNVGPYNLCEQIGEGGMGLVFVAEQSSPVRRQVALKVCKPGLDTEEVMARFEAERQALALMDHPNIAKMFDAGTTDSGRPFFVMELVRGIPITDYCEKAKLGTHERLKLFITVCQAVQHAHLKGIIHRDIKPSNAMVTLHDGVPVPKVIDFGVAKATGQRLTEQTVYTQYQQIIGTPLYMSPEQAEFSGLDIDTRTDVYSLGVLLYELLTGTTPFDRQTLTEKGFDEFKRLLSEQDPPRPSARISTLDAAAQSTLALQRGLDPRRLCQSLKGELDWIVMKSLEKDRNRRYESATGLADDVERYLHDEPVTACPPSNSYRLQKFARRNRSALLTTALIALSLVIGTIVSSWMAVVATNARRLADQRLAEKQQAVDLQQAAIEAKDIALEREWEANQRVYPINIASADGLLNDGSIEAASNILRLLIPTAGAADRRGFAWHYLWGLCERRGQPLLGHTSPVYCVSFSPDSRLLATASGDHTVRLWDTETASLKRVLKGHTSDVNGIAFSPTGETLATASDDHTIGIWDTATGERLTTLHGHTHMVICPAYSPDGKVIASGDTDGVLKTWDAATGGELASIQAHDDWIHCLTVSSNGSRLASCAKDQAVKVWDLRSLELIATFDNRERDDLQAVTFQPGTERLFAGFRYGGTIKAWDIHTLQPIDEWNAGLYLLGLAFSPDGQTLATPGGGRSLILWNADDFYRQAVYSLGPYERSSWCAAFSPDGRFLAAGDGEDATLIRTSQPPNYQQLGRLEVDIEYLTVAPDAQTVLVGCEDGTLRGFDIINGEVSRQHAHADGVSSVEYSPDETLLVTGGGDGIVRIRDASSMPRSLPGFAGPIHDVAFSVDGRKLAACDTSQIKVWETNAWQLVDEWPADGVWHLGFSRDGRVLMGGISRPQIRETNRETVSLHLGAPAEQHLPRPVVNAMDVTRDGTHAAFGIRRFLNPVLFDLARYHDTGVNWGTTFSRQRNHHIIAVAFTQDGRTLAAADRRGWIALWDVASGTKLLTRTTAELTGLPDLYDRICLAFAPDDSALVCGIRPAYGEGQTGPKGVIFVIHAPRLDQQPRTKLESTSQTDL